MKEEVCISMDNQYYEDAPAVESGKKGLAIASLVLGIIGVLGCCCFGGVLGIVGLILGIISITKQGKSGMAIAGIILSAISVLGLIYLLFSFGASMGEIGGIEGFQSIYQSAYDSISQSMNAAGAIFARF